MVHPWFYEATSDLNIVLNLHECMEARFHHWKKGYYNFLTILMKYIFFHRIAIYKLAIQIFFARNCDFSPELWDMNLQLWVNV